ncbi:type II secretory pathway protein [Burkholderia sp. WAC0059]|uniref:PulJ/GspJ family protein n=1 Tax=Burkholderia sp. WAC0059 TaxID=2066022 RepID=UPI000C7E9AF5|nr:prepilin-type N-terminal cleavage/methylation domain-containing protein [Burkholderia sp. WAC0059]PLZ01751.1 type II secretory pathway protein [Burkholderia sp. WAC0059]
MNHSSRSPAPRRTAGFTLIELLIAIALLSVVAVMAWRGLDAAIRSRNSLVDNLSEIRSLGRYFSQMQYDVLNLVDPGEVFGPPLLVLPDELVIVRHVGAGSPRSRLQVVRYQLKGHVLLRSASPPLNSLSDLLTSLHHMDSYAGVTISDDVRSMGIEVWLVPVGWTDQQWRVDDVYASFLKAHGISNSTTQGIPLPRGLRITIRTESPGEQYVRTFPLAQ